MNDALPEYRYGFSGHRYHAYNDWARREYGGRLQKVSIDAGFTCPNRDGLLGVGGCTFCNNEGFSPSYLREQRDILTQIDTGIEFMVLLSGGASQADAVGGGGRGQGLREIVRAPW